MMFALIGCSIALALFGCGTNTYETSRLTVADAVVDYFLSLDDRAYTFALPKSLIFVQASDSVVQDYLLSRRLSGKGLTFLPMDSLAPFRDRISDSDVSNAQLVRLNFLTIKDSRAVVKVSQRYAFPQGMNAGFHAFDLEFERGFFGGWHLDRKRTTGIE